MWLAKFKMKHDCIIGNRCEKFKVICQGSNPSVYKEHKNNISSSMFYMSGSPENIEKFVKDLSKDKNVIKLERKGDMFFLLEKAEEKAVQFYTPKIIFVKPVLIDIQGYEHWEVASWERKEVENFVDKVEKTIDNFELKKIIQIKIDNVFFPKLMPDLTEKQKQAIDLAIQEGYYKNPRKIDLRKLAKLMGISLATYQQHLRVAEEKLIPNLLSYSQ